MRALKFEILKRRWKIVFSNNVLLRKAIWIGHILRRNYLHNDATEGQMTEVNRVGVCLGGLGVTYSPRDSRFADSNPTVDVFFQDVKILSTSPPGGTLSWGSRV